MKKITFFAALAAAAAVLSCNPDEKPNDQKPEEVKFSLSEDNIKVSGLEKEYVVNVDNAAAAVDIYADYLDADNIKALDISFTGLEEGVTVAYEQVFNYAQGSQKVTFTKKEKEFVYSFSVTLGEPSPEFTSLSVAGVAVAGGEVKLSSAVKLAECVVEFAVSPAETKVFVDDAEIESGDPVDFSDKVNGVTFTLKCASVTKEVNVKAVTTGINSIVRVWGHYVKPDSCTDDWFGTKVTGALDAIRNVALSDTHVFLSKDKVKVEETIDRAGCYAVSIADPSDVKLLSREGFDDNTRFFSVTTLGNTPFLPTFVMNEGGHLIIYKYDSLDADPVVALDYVLPSAMRLGDKISSEGTLENGKLYLYDTTSGKKVLCFAVKDGKVEATPTVIDLDTKQANYGAFYKYDDTHFVCSTAGSAATMFTLSGTLAEAEFQFSTTKFPVPSHGFRFFTVNEEEYMALVNLRNSYQDGQFRVYPMAGATLEDKVNADINPFVYYLGDPETKEDGTRVKNGNGLGDGDFRVIDGRNYYAAYVPGTGLSLFELK